ncbi:core-binding factor subunit beta-like isoform X1 [Acanthaster planci]|uniref:Core-binding factor subunit beta-like isoform X1 n=1 Tax=Acanthaster planci TaxID=133434 RepID=A0A8B7YPV2_ACAPL|nr:core-binding factor subunit beta-like isoform X1 [Acanthaster planci]
MPRVVPDQRAKFENDELFRKLGRESEIKYTGFRDRSHEERQVRFQAGCREGHAELAFSSTGTNLHLHFLPPNSHNENGKTERLPTREYVDFDREIGRVHLKTRFILNGVCVVCKAWVDLQRLDGIGYVEFDEDKARMEDAVLRQSLAQQNRRLMEFEERQRIQREELERQAEAEVEARRRGQPSPASTSGSSGGTNSSGEGC